MTFTTRFAPSPTGPLHLGHAYSALLAFDLARAEGGVFHLRIDDLDASRSRPEWEARLKDDLHWLGLEWPEPCRRKSAHLQAYDAALDQLWQKGLLYPCTCTRRDIREALSAPQEGSLPQGPDGLIYPGTCAGHARGSPGTPRPAGTTLRLDMAAACAALSRGPLGFIEEGCGPNRETGHVEIAPEALITGVGDVVVARKEAGAAYHLAVVVDDAAQQITHVIRGQDLFEATRIHVVLQRLLQCPSPVYHHHRLIRDAAGKRLAKRDDARAIATYRAEGTTPGDIRRMVGLS